MALILSTIHTESVRRFCTESGDWTTCTNPALSPEYMEGAYIVAVFAFLLVLLSAAAAPSRKLLVAVGSFVVWGVLVTLAFRTVIGFLWLQYVVVALGGGLGVLCGYWLWRDDQHG